MRPPIATTPVHTAGDILVVDDNPSNLAAIEGALDGFEGDLVYANSGEEALRWLLEREFALVLLDVQMPSMDGFETARLIRQRQKTRHIPIIFITAFSQHDEDILTGYELGAVDFLFKPIKKQVLQAKVSVFVELQRHAAEAARQAELLREHERMEHEQQLRAEKQKWEAEALRQSNRQLEEADRRKDRFLAVLAHELRNPLAPILISLELIRGADISDPRLTRAVAAMDRQIMHLVRLIDDLLDVSRITSGKIELRMEVASLQQAIIQAQSMTAPIIAERHHQLRIDMPDEPIHVHGDPVRLAQIVANLLTNAARYTPPGGKLSVSGEIEGGEAVLRVIDNGRGIVPEMLDRVFEMFIQAQPGGEGLGLGLALVAQLVQLHDGRVAAYSEGPGKGSEFTVWLPCVDVDRVVVRGDVDRHHDIPDTLRIALIEDDDDIRTMMDELLTTWGHEVVSANTGKDGVELLIRARPDVALVDIGLPDIDGYTVARDTCTAMGDDRPRLIAMTGYGQKRDRDRARNAGFDAHIIKPATADILRHELSRCAPNEPSVRVDAHEREPTPAR